MASQDFTITLDDETAREVEALAHEAGTSVSDLVARQIHRLFQSRQARQDAPSQLSEVDNRGGMVRWTREELYDRWKG
ncbi:MAG TPA: ribbon-helix-helix protein, CopG family [Pseudonocardiaceae bacterium]|nr:ribbon-helix-helix protein, CopG family [Pseudonocardiaceae bacterium]